MIAKRDKAILQELQDNFPAVSRPYAAACEKFGLTEDELIRKVKALKKRKLIRYCGAIFENKKLGVKSTLVALSVPKTELPRVAKAINRFPQVSHNYLRRGQFNVWFTVSAGSKRELSGVVGRIKKITGVDRALNLETVKVFKINARFNF